MNTTVSSYSETLEVPTVETLESNAVKSNSLVKITGGTFQMGNTDEGKGYSQEKPSFIVNLDSFYISKYCVTSKSFFEFVQDLGKEFNDSWIFCINPCFIYKHVNKYRLAENADDYPMINVSYEGALAYCNWLSLKFNLTPVYDTQTLVANFNNNGFRLPTEAEWEFSCKGPNNFTYAVSNTFETNKINSQIYEGEQGHLRAGTNKTGGFGLYNYSPIKVGSLAPNINGLYEMLGNVHEWCYDKYAPYTAENKSNPNTNDIENSSFRVIRGAAFNSDLNMLRSTYRHAFHYKAKCYSLGFRIAKNTYTN